MYFFFSSKPLISLLSLSLLKMGDSEDETGYPKKFYPLNRLNHLMYTRPILKRHAYYREEDDNKKTKKSKKTKEKDIIIVKKRG